MDGALVPILASFAGAFAGGVSAYFAMVWLQRRHDRRAAIEYEQNIRESFRQVFAECNARGDGDQPAADNERGRIH